MHSPGARHCSLALLCPNQRLALAVESAVVWVIVLPEEHNVDEPRRQDPYRINSAFAET